MKNFIQKGDTLDLVAPYDRNSGQAAKIGSIIAVAVNNVLSGAVGQFLTEGVVGPIDKAASQVWAQGAILYWDDTAKNFTTTSSANTKCGYAAVAALSADVVGTVFLNGASG